RRLTKEGYFETYILESNEGPARKYYKITPEGIESLNRLKSEWNEFVYAVNTFLND
ncbi:PadR family transcriptional regulator, partial [Clostridium sp.]